MYFLFITTGLSLIIGFISGVFLYTSNIFKLLILLCLPSLFLLGIILLFRILGFITISDIDFETNGNKFRDEATSYAILQALLILFHIITFFEHMYQYDWDYAIYVKKISPFHHNPIWYYSILVSATLLFCLTRPFRRMIYIHKLLEDLSKSKSADSKENSSKELNENG